MKDIITGSSKEGDYIALVSSETEVEIIQQLIKDKNDEFLVRDMFPIKHVVGIGDPREITDEEIRKYIRFRVRDGDKLYACHCPVPHYTVNHYNALSSWLCVMEALNYPRYVVLVLIPRVVDKELTEKGFNPYYNSKLA